MGKHTQQEMQQKRTVRAKKRMNCTITRIANACVLIEIGEVRILTDPWFQGSRFFTERAGLAPEALPRLDAILGGHWAYDHWDMAALASLPDKAHTRVRVADASMVRPARKAGFTDVQVMAWGATERLGDVTIESIREHALWGKRSSNYLVAGPDARLFVGSEARDLEAAQEFAQRHPPCDAALGPVNGVCLLGFPLVADAAEMIGLARTVGAKQLIPIHDSHKPIWGLQQVRSSAADLAHLDTKGLQVVQLTPGESHAVA